MPLATDLKLKMQENLAAIRDFTLMDDTFMTQVFSGNKKVTEFLLKIILEKDDLHVMDAITQLPIANIYGKSVRLDIYARDSEEKQYDIEIQQRDDGAIPKRARLNSSLFDAKLTDHGKKYKQIPETYVIFITENDVLGYDLPIYEIDRYIKQNGASFLDRAHIIYVNGAYRKDDAIGRLMDDFHCKDYKKMKNKPLADAVKYYKEDPKGVSEMCDAMDKISKRRADEAVIEDRAVTARALWEDGCHDFDKLSNLTRLTLEQLKEALNIQHA